MKICGYKELRVYQLAVELQNELFIISREFPKDELYSLVSQIRRSSRSIGANIAEAWHKRIYAAHFTSKLTDADAEQAETQHWIETAHACLYITSEKKTELADKCISIGKMIGAMIMEPKKWCK
jgi:four helix bundle protein